MCAGQGKSLIILSRAIFFQVIGIFIKNRFRRIIYQKTQRQKNIAAKVRDDGMDGCEQKHKHRGGRSDLVSASEWALPLST
jgi:hypothetical protein